MDTKATQSETGLASYTILSFDRETLPESYINLILSKWLRSYRFGNDIIKLNETDAYYTAYHRHIETVLRQPNVLVRIAALTDDKDVVLGFSVSRGQTLDYVYVHRDNRRIGIGTKLVPPGIERFTHVTKTALSIWANKRDLNWKLDLFA